MEPNSNEIMLEYSLFVLHEGRVSNNIVLKFSDSLTYKASKQRHRIICSPFHVITKLIRSYFCPRLYYNPI
jgi:hypothetical protein